MGHRVNFHHEQLMEHLQEREWSAEDIAHFTHMIGHSALMSEQGVLFVLEFQRTTDERIQAEKDFDQAFVPGVPQSFFEDSSEALEPGFIEQRFGERQ